MQKFDKISCAGFMHTPEIRGIYRSLLSFYFVFSFAIEAQSFSVYPYLQAPDSTGITVVWFSDDSIAGQVEFNMKGVVDTRVVRSVPQLASALAFTTWESETYYGGNAPAAPYKHSVRLDSLHPWTVYSYKVTQQGEAFEAEFKTAPKLKRPFRFMVYGDPETEPESTGKFAKWEDPISGATRNYVIDQTQGYTNNLDLIRSRHPDFVIVAGDLVESGGEQRDWDEFWLHNAQADPSISLAATVPIMAVLGNHDYFSGPSLGIYDQPASETAVNRYLTYFEPPSNHAPVAAHKGRYYSMPYGVAYFIMLDVCNNGSNGSNDDTNFYLLGEWDPNGGNAPDFGPGSTQYNWLRAELEKAQKESLFTFVTLHHAPYSVGPHGWPAGLGNGFDKQSGVPVRSLTPLFMEFGVDAVFAGHDEMLERSELHGMEKMPDGQEVEHVLQFYDVGIGGDGLRGPSLGLTNAYQTFLVHNDAPEIWDGDTLREGGKHYGHVEVNIDQLSEAEWEAVLSPVYVLPVLDKVTGKYEGYKRKIYDDVVTIHSTDPNVPAGNGIPVFYGVQEWEQKVAVFPNPFAAYCTLKFDGLPLPKSIDLIDVLGKRVRHFSNRGGKKHIVWDGRDGQGAQLHKGLYVFQLNFENGKQVCEPVFYRW